MKQEQVMSQKWEHWNNCNGGRITQEAAPRSEQGDIRMEPNTPGVRSKADRYT